MARSPGGAGPHVQAGDMCKIDSLLGTAVSCHEFTGIAITDAEKLRVTHFECAPVTEVNREGAERHTPQPAMKDVVSNESARLTPRMIVDFELGNVGVQQLLKLAASVIHNGDLIRQPDRDPRDVGDEESAAVPREYREGHKRLSTHQWSNVVDAQHGRSPREQFYTRRALLHSRPCTNAVDRHQAGSRLMPVSSNSSGSQARPDRWSGSHRWAPAGPAA